MWRHELESVGVAGKDNRFYPVFGGFLGDSADYVVGLVAWDFVDGNAHRRYDLFDVSDLGVKLGWRLWPVCLVTVELLVAEGGPRWVEGDGNVGRPQVSDCLEHAADEPVDASYVLACSPVGQRLLLECEPRPEQHGVAVHNHEKGRLFPVEQGGSALSGGRPCFLRHFQQPSSRLLSSRVEG